MGESPSNKQMYGKITTLITESAEFLARYMQDLEGYRRRSEAAKDLLKDSTDIKAPDDVYRPFSVFDPI